MMFQMPQGKRSRSQSQQKELMRLQEERSNLLSEKSDFFIREAYKTLRTNVTFSLTGEGMCKVVVVTSSLQSEGKSFTAANLAISYAQADNRVLLVDCDLRKPKLSRLLRLSAKVGLSNLLMHPERLNEAVLSTQVKNLSVILSGDIPPNPSELLGSVRMQRLLEELKKQFDYIILDTPPVNMVTDAAVLAPQSDGVLFVVRANQSERGAVIHAVEQLGYTQTKILGFVLNGVDMEKSSYGYGKYRYKRYSKYKKYGYYGHGGYGYGYGYEGQSAAPAEQPKQQKGTEEP